MKKFIVALFMSLSTYTQAADGPVEQNDEHFLPTRPLTLHDVYELMQLNIDDFLHELKNRFPQDRSQAEEIPEAITQLYHSSEEPEDHD